MEIKLVLLALVGGLVGGAISNRRFEGLPVFAQATKASYSRVLKAERLELVNQQGKAVAVFDIRYGSAFPGHSGFPDGSPVLTLNDEFDGQAREVSMSTARILMSYGKEALFSVQVEDSCSTRRRVWSISVSLPFLLQTAPGADSEFDAARELASFGGVGPDQPAIRLFAKNGSAHAILTLLPDETGSMFLADRNGTPSWHATGDLK
jgi:hypothetical protein